MMKKAVIFDMYGVLLSRNLLLRERENVEVAKVAAELKERGVRLFLLSNIYIRGSAHYKAKYGFIKLFDQLYFSSDIGFAKPDRRAFELVLKENNLEAGDCLFIDDTRANVEAARALGIESHLFRKNIHKLRDFLK